MVRGAYGDDQGGQRQQESGELGRPEAPRQPLHLHVPQPLQDQGRHPPDARAQRPPAERSHPRDEHVGDIAGVQRPAEEEVVRRGPGQLLEVVGYEHVKRKRVDSVKL